MKWLRVLFVWLLFLFCYPAYSQSIVFINPSGPVTPLRGLAWGGSGGGGFNNAFVFSPLSQNESVCISVKNNNTTSTHTFAASINITLDPGNSNPFGNGWTTVYSNSGFSLSPTQYSSGGSNVSGAAQISVQLSQGTTQAGSPDTADIIILQTNGNCNGVFSNSSGQSNLGQPIQGPVANGSQAQNPIGIAGSDTATLVGNSGTNRAIGTASANNMFGGAIFPATNTLLVERLAKVTATNTPAAGSAASATRASGGANVAHVTDCVSFSATSTGAVTATNVSFVIRNGASGSGTIFWQYSLAVPTAGAAGVQVIPPTSFCGLNIITSLNFAVTCEFTAGVANVQESANCSIFDVQ